MKKRVLAGILAVLLSASVVFDPIQQTVVQASEMNQIETVTNESIVETETANASKRCSFSRRNTKVGGLPL